MSKGYISGFQRLARYESGTVERYRTALIAVKENFTGFTKKAGFDPAKPEKLTPAQRHQIRRYYNALIEYTEGQPVYKMLPGELPEKIKKAKNGVDTVKRAAGMKKARKRSKYIFIKYDGESIPKVGVRNNVPTFIDPLTGTEREFIEIDPVSLAVDLPGTMQKVKELTQGAKFYTIQAGLWEADRNGKIGAAGDIGSLQRQITFLQNKYQTGNHAWQNWLRGINAVYKTSYKDYSINRRKTAEFHREDVAKDKARAKRAGEVWSYSDYVKRKNAEIWQKRRNAK